MVSASPARHSGGSIRRRPDSSTRLFMKKLNATVTVVAGTRNGRSAPGEVVEAVRVVVEVGCTSYISRLHGV